MRDQLTSKQGKHMRHSNGRACTVCGNKHAARDMCRKHLQRFYTWGRSDIIGFSNGNRYFEREYMEDGCMIRKLTPARRQGRGWVPMTIK